MVSTIKDRTPGFAVALVVAIVSQFLTLVIPDVGAATISIILGIILGNTFVKQAVLSAGTKFAEKRLLEYSVMLLGLTITFQTIIQLHWSGLLFIVIQMSVTIVAAIMIGKWLQFDDGIYLSMAGGNAVCGSSAIASIKPVINASDEDAGMAITLVNLMGTVLMLLLPILGTVVFGSSDMHRGALIGGTVQSVGQVIASATMVNQSTVEFATLFKIMRIIMLVVIVMVFARIHQHNVSEKQTVEEVEADVKKHKIDFLPWYVLWFLIFCIANSFVHLPSLVGTTAHFLSSWCEIIALAAIGLRLNLQAFLKAGKRFAIYSLGVGTIQVVVALVLIKLLIH
ncbi:putative sulfate exporter family transporter [Nicoliella spurrieriana]|uniref:Sulfate exporter family transporter n=1 Tax=Nicoliella spurrieriana TaxID=2925830 RepID=A0A976RT56_9LACO|nr:putative sulfate exporter family transporter [Nicoliella spurrieriana]UQS87371.1 putative sulfate exporter family transporter [Nicoliella spurrieriana]